MCSMVRGLRSWGQSGICFHLLIGAGVLSFINGSDWTDSKGVARGTAL